MEQIEIQTQGKYNITYKNVQYDFEGGNKYTVDKETAEMLIENGYAIPIETKENVVSKSKKSNNNKQ